MIRQRSRILNDKDLSWLSELRRIEKRSRLVGDGMSPSLDGSVTMDLMTKLPAVESSSTSFQDEGEDDDQDKES